MNIHVNKQFCGYLFIFFQLSFFITVEAIKCGTKCKSCAMSCQKRLTTFRNKQSCILSCSPEFQDQKVSFVDPYWNCIHVDCLKAGAGLPKHITSDDDWNKWDCPKNCLTKNNDRDHLVNINDIQSDTECDDLCRMCRFTCFVSATRYAKDIAHKTSDASLDDTEMRKLILSLRERSIGCISSCEKCQTPCLKLKNEDNQKRCWRSCCPSFSNTQTVDFYGPYYDCMSEQCFANGSSSSNTTDRQMPSRIASDQQFTNWDCQQTCAKVENAWKNEIILESKVECNETCDECQQRCDYLEFPYHRYACKESCSELFSANSKLQKNLTINYGYYQCLHDKCFVDKTDMNEKLQPTNDTSQPTGLDMNFYGWKCRRNCWEQHPTSWRDYLRKGKKSDPLKPELEWKTIDDFWPTKSAAQTPSKDVGVIDSQTVTKAQEQSRCQCIETELKIMKRQKFAKDLFDELENAVNSKKQKKIKPKKGLVIKEKGLAIKEKVMVIKEKHRTDKGSNLGKEIDDEIGSFNEKSGEENAESSASAGVVDDRVTSKESTSERSMVYTELTATTESKRKVATTQLMRTTNSDMISETNKLLLTTIENNVIETTTANNSLITITVSLEDNNQNFNASSVAITTPAEDKVLENKETIGNNTGDSNTTSSIIEEIDTTNVGTSFGTTTESVDDIKGNADTVDEQIDENSNATTDESLQSNVDETNSTEDSDQDSEVIKNSVDSVDDNDEEVVTDGKTNSIGNSFKPMSKKRKRRKMRKNLTNKLVDNSGRRKRRKKMKPIVNQLKSKPNKGDAFKHKVLKEVVAVNTTASPKQFTDIIESSTQNGTIDTDSVNSTSEENSGNQMSNGSNNSITTEITELITNTIDTTDVNVTLRPVLNETELSVATINETALTVKPIDDKELKVTPINDDILTVTPIDADIKESADSVADNGEINVENTTVVTNSIDNFNNTSKITETVTSSLLETRSEQFTTENIEQLTNITDIVNKTVENDVGNGTDVIANSVITLVSTIVSTESVEDSADIVTENQSSFSGQNETNANQSASIVLNLGLNATKTVFNSNDTTNETEKVLSESEQGLNNVSELFTGNLMNLTTIQPESVEDKADVVTENDSLNFTEVPNLTIGGYTTAELMPEMITIPVNTNNYDNQITASNELRIDADVVTEQDIADTGQTKLPTDDLNSTTVRYAQPVSQSDPSLSTEQSLDKSLENNADIVTENFFGSESIYSNELLSTITTVDYKFESTIANVDSNATADTVYGSVTMNDIFNVTINQEMMQKNSSSMEGGRDVEKESGGAMATIEPFDMKTTNLVDETYTTIGELLTTGEELSIATEFAPKTTYKLINTDIDSDSSEPSVGLLSLDVKYNQQKDENEGDNEKKISDIKSQTDNMDDDQKEERKYNAIKIGVKSDLMKKKLSFDINQQKYENEGENEKKISDIKSPTINVDDEQNEERNDNAIQFGIKSDLTKKKLSFAIKRE